MKKINVCVFPAQNECAVEINNALSNLEGIEVFGVTSIRGHNEFNFKNYYCNMEDIESDSFISSFERFIVEHKIDVVFPTTDGTAVFFAINKDFFSAIITTPDEFTVTLINDKKRTFEYFKDCDFCPLVFEKFTKFPCFIKPIDGEGAQGTKLIKEKNDIPEKIDLDKYVICEYLPGREITVDCVTDYKGNLSLVLPRERTRVFSGMCVKGVTLDINAEINKIARTINEKLKFKGLWFFQLKEDDSGRFKLLEISSRCAGTMCLSRARGFNLPLLTVYTLLNKPIETIDNNLEVFLDRTLFARYRINVSFDTIYVDYDGTIIVKEKVCLDTIRFLYQCKNNKKRIILITRHNDDHDDSIEESMKKSGISQDLFDEIISLSFAEEKYTAIRDENAIFIDNSYLERMKVKKHCGIPVFGVDGLDALQDWRL